jgi:hypothetical protein
MFSIETFVWALILIIGALALVAVSLFTRLHDETESKERYKAQLLKLTTVRKLLVIAENHGHADRYTRAIGLHRNEWIFVHHVSQLQGIDKATVIIYETAHRHPDWNALRDYLFILRTSSHRNIEIVSGGLDIAREFSPGYEEFRQEQARRRIPNTPSSPVPSRPLRFFNET